MPDDGDLTLTLPDAGKQITGWTEIAVRRGIERCPSSFEIGLTQLQPGVSATLPIKVFDRCTVSIGADLVVTGFVDRIQPSLAARQHSIRITGRGKCADLVDCSAYWPSGVMKNVTPLAIAQNLLQDLGGTVAVTGGPGDQIPQINVNVTDTIWSIIEKTCRWSALLAYDGPDGDLILGPVGTTAAASGAVQGQNVIAFDGTLAGDHRYSEYDAFLMSIQLTSDVGAGGNLLAKALDPNVPRKRRLSFVAEAPAGGQQTAQKRAIWEANRRAGRGLALKVTVDSWRDATGKLWTPNTLIAVDIADAMIEPTQLLIGDVAYLRDRDGTRCELVLMPPEAFQPEPIQLLPTFAGVQ